MFIFQFIPHLLNGDQLSSYKERETVQVNVSPSVAQFVYIASFILYRSTYLQAINYIRGNQFHEGTEETIIAIPITISGGKHWLR